MRRSGWEAPTYPSFDFRQSAEKSLVLSLKLASARTLRARRSGTGPGRWVDLASLKASRPRMYALGRAGRPRSRHFTAKRLSKTTVRLHRSRVGAPFQTAPSRPRRGFEATAPPGGAATRQIAPPTRAPAAGRGPTDARHSRRARARSHHGHREATKTPQLQRLLLTENEDQPRAARRAEDEARVLLL